MKRCHLYRGDHRLPHQSQVLQRDLNAEQIRARWAGKEAYAYALTEEQFRERQQRGGHGPYRYLVHSPDSSALAWTAFENHPAMTRFLRAYGLKKVGRGGPGMAFVIKIPKNPRMKKLRKICY